jgi:hypothetical protein
MRAPVDMEIGQPITGVEVCQSDVNVPGESEFPDEIRLSAVENETRDAPPYDESSPVTVKSGLSQLSDDNEQPPAVDDTEQSPPFDVTDHSPAFDEFEIDFDNVHVSSKITFSLTFRFYWPFQ